jgi:hypothetical protein
VHKRERTGKNNRNIQNAAWVDERNLSTTFSHDFCPLVCVSLNAACLESRRLATWLQMIYNLIKSPKGLLTPSEKKGAGSLAHSVLGRAAQLLQLRNAGKVKATR